MGDMKVMYRWASATEIWSPVGVAPDSPVAGGRTEARTVRPTENVFSAKAGRPYLLASDA
jgi:hypothetical protein